MVGQAANLAFSRERILDPAVRVLVSFAGREEGDAKWVERVAVTRDLQMVVIIHSEGYHFYLFQILLQ